MSYRFLLVSPPGEHAVGNGFIVFHSGLGWPAPGCCGRSNGSYFSGDGPHKGAQLASGGADNGLVLFASGDHFPEAATQSYLGLPGDVTNHLWQSFLPLQQDLADPGREPIGLGGLDQDFSDVAIAGLGYSSGSPGAAAGMLGGNRS